MGGGSGPDSTKGGAGTVSGSINGIAASTMAWGSKEGRAIRQLENRLTKAQLKANEAQSIRRTYEQVRVWHMRRGQHQRSIYSSAMPLAALCCWYGQLAVKQWWRPAGSEGSVGRCGRAGIIRAACLHSRQEVEAGAALVGH